MMTEFPREVLNAALEVGEGSRSSDKEILCLNILLKTSALLPLQFVKLYLYLANITYPSSVGEREEYLGECMKVTKAVGKMRLTTKISSPLSKSMALKSLYCETV